MVATPFLASAYCCHEELSTVVTPSFMPQPAAYSLDETRYWSCSQGQHFLSSLPSSLRDGTSAKAGCHQEGLPTLSCGPNTRKRR